MYPRMVYSYTCKQVYISVFNYRYIDIYVFTTSHELQKYMPCMQSALYTLYMNYKSVCLTLTTRQDFLYGALPPAPKYMYICIYYTLHINYKGICPTLTTRAKAFCTELSLKLLITCIYRYKDIQYIYTIHMNYKSICPTPTTRAKAFCTALSLQHHSSAARLASSSPFSHGWHACSSHLNS